MNRIVYEKTLLLWAVFICFGFATKFLELSLQQDSRNFTFGIVLLLIGTALLFIYNKMKTTRKWRISLNDLIKFMDKEEVKKYLEEIENKVGGEEKENDSSTK